jgi:hypothetical protein
MQRNRISLTLLLPALLAGLIAVPLTAGNIIVNSDFSQPLNVGWKVNSTDDQPAVALVREQPGCVRISHTASGYTTLGQRIPVPNGNLKLSFSGWFSATVNRPGYGSMADVSIFYLDADSNVLGQTAFALIEGKSPLADQSNLHIIPITTDSQWADYTLALSQELKDNLPNVDPTLVKYVDIALGADNGADQGC